MKSRFLLFVSLFLVSCFLLLAFGCGTPLNPVTTTISTATTTSTETSTSATGTVTSTSTSTTLDTVRPSVISQTPNNVAVDVFINSAISAIFSKAMDDSTISTATFTLSSGEAPVSGTVSYNGDSSSVLFTPSANLAFNTTYVATISASVRDLVGNEMGTNNYWIFTTGSSADVTLPTVESVWPANGEVDVPVDSVMRAVFSKDMDATTINHQNFRMRRGSVSIEGNVSYDAAAKTAYFIPTELLMAGVTCTATVRSDVKDLSGNFLASNYNWTFVVTAVTTTTSPSSTTSSTVSTTSTTTSTTTTTLAPAWRVLSYTGTESDLYAVKFIDNDNGWVVGDSWSLFHSINGGVTYEYKGPGFPFNCKAVDFTSLGKGWVAGAGNNIFHTDNAGTVWASYESGVTASFNDVKFIGEKGWAVSASFPDPMAPGFYAAKIIHSTNEGSSWSSQLTVMSVCGIYSLSVVDENNVWALDGSGTCYITTNEGTSWLARTAPIANPRDLFFVDANMGWIVGGAGTIIHTVNGGGYWTTQESGLVEDLRSVYFLDHNNGWVVGDNGKILSTTNEGTTWLTQESGSVNILNAVYFTNLTHGWAVGANGTMIKYSY